MVLVANEYVTFSGIAPISESLMGKTKFSTLASAETRRMATSSLLAAKPLEICDARRFQSSSVGVLPAFRISSTSLAISRAKSISGMAPHSADYSGIIHNYTGATCSQQRRIAYLGKIL